MRKKIISMFLVTALLSVAGVEIYPKLKLF